MIELPVLKKDLSELYLLCISVLASDPEDPVHIFLTEILALELYYLPSVFRVRVGLTKPVRVLLDVCEGITRYIRILGVHIKAGSRAIQKGDTVRGFLKDASEGFPFP